MDLAAASNYPVEQLAAKLREHEKLQCQARFPRPVLQADNSFRPGPLSSYLYEKAGYHGGCGDPAKA